MSACYPVQGSDGLFTNTTCCRRPESDTVGKVLPPTAGERDRLKEWGCLSHFSVTPDVM